MATAATHVASRAARGDDLDTHDNDELADKYLTHDFCCE